MDPLTMLVAEAVMAERRRRADEARHAHDLRARRVIGRIIGWRSRCPD